MGENQQQFLRSVNHDRVALVRFINKTPRSVHLYWIDYEGRAVNYGVLFTNGYVDVDTYVTHPWIFVDSETRDRYTVNQKDVYFPEPSGPRGDTRVFAYITLPMYTLKEVSLRAIKRCLSHRRHAFLLDIPRSLQLELARMVPADDDDSAVGV